MLHRNNLGTEFGNGYYKVVAPFNLFILIGNADSNTYVGASKMLGNVYREITLNVGDELHDLMGGVFATYQGNLHPCRMKLSEKHPFEKVYMPECEVFPVANLQPTDTHATLPYYKMAMINVPIRRVGRGIDAVAI